MAASIITNGLIMICLLSNVLCSEIEGVAVTLFFHSPRWFQLRYTMMVNNIAANIPENWKIQIFYINGGGSKKGIDLNIGLQKLVVNGKLVFTQIPSQILQQKKKRAVIMTDVWFWENVLADKVLMFGGNSVMCGNSPYSLADFYQYDYVGSPWGSVKKGAGGDGLISLRNRRVMLQAIQYKLDQTPAGERREDQYKKWGGEDTFFVNAMLEMKQLPQYKHFNIAPLEACMKWGAVNNYANHTVLTASGTLAGVRMQERAEFLDYCMELKIIFPLLHDPACFGADPNATLCALSICALQPKEKRKGGC